MSTNGFSHEIFEESGLSLYEAIFDQGDTLDSVASEWVNMYKEETDNQTKSLLSLINFIIRVRIYAHIYKEGFEKDDEIPTVLEELQDAFKKEGVISYGLRDAILISLIKMFLRTGKSLRYLYFEEIDCSHFKFNYTTITNVDLVLPHKVSSKFKRKTIDGLIENIKENPTLTTLNFVSIHMGIKPMKKLIKAFDKSTALNSLGVHNFPLGNKSGKLLATYLTRNTTMTSLHLTGKKNIENIGLKLGNQLTEVLSLEKNVLTSLDLGFNNIGSQGGIELANALKNNIILTYLVLRRNNIGPEGGLALAKALCINTTLTLLDVRENHIGALGDTLCMNTTLNWLDISSNNLGQKVGEALADAFYKNISLKGLSLQKNSLGPDAGKAIKEALCQNATLTYLDLLSNGIDFEDFLEPIQVLASIEETSVSIEEALVSIKESSKGPLQLNLQQFGPDIASNIFNNLLN
ncbi:hypothetical protein C2G38_2175416 [Gigaspora rosea]|uniref:Uncharacterized protein n=1 Tax=Gigaspora rosea TaxID=44941 RepID=A0A397VJ60_9GLOM|nr:hypothetical protein C2G38_2175416 [Gigaspora rosea]